MFGKFLKSFPYKYQLKIIKAALRLRGAALFMEQGTGKTLVSLGIVAERHDRGQVDIVYVLCPKSVVPVWVREIRKHMGLYPRVVTSWDEFDPYRLKYRKGKDERLIFVIMNYEHMIKRIKKIVRENSHMAIADECHKLSNRASAQSRGAHRIADRSDYRLGLTGTPMGNNEELDLWSQFKFIDSDVLGSRFGDFEDRFCRKGGWMGYKTVIRKRRVKQIHKKIKPITFRVDQDDVLDLPAEIPPQELFFELNAKQQKLYDKMETTAVIKVGENEDKYITSGLAVTTAMKLHQITGGSVKDNDGNTHFIGNSKLRVLEDFIKYKPYKNKFLIGTNFNGDVDQVSDLLSKLKIKHLILKGGKESDAGTIEKQFHEDDKVKALICQIKAGSMGLDFTPADMTIFFSLPRSWRDFDQFKKRTRRNGQTRKTRYVYLLSEKTVDIDIYSSLQDNTDIAQNFTQSLKEKSNGSCQENKRNKRNR